MPIIVPRERAGKRIASSLGKHFALGPVLAVHVDRAQTREGLEATAWERGVSDAAGAFDNPRSALGAVQALLAGGFGVVTGAAVTQWPLLAQFALGGVVGLLVYWLVPTVWAGCSALQAPVRQRNEARTALGLARRDVESRVAERSAALQARVNELEAERGGQQELMRRHGELVELYRDGVSMAEELFAQKDRLTAEGARNRYLAWLDRVEQAADHPLMPTHNWAAPLENDRGLKFDSAEDVARVAFQRLHEHLAALQGREEPWARLPKIDPPIRGHQNPFDPPPSGRERA